MPPPRPKFPLPTERQRLAHNLHAVHGLTDAQIGEAINCTREWACKLRAEFRRRVEAIAAASGEDGIEIIKRLNAKPPKR